MKHLKLAYVDPVKLKPNPQNAKIHTDKQIATIAKSMTNTEGSVQPIVVDEDYMILAGHGRWLAHKKRGDVECPIIVKSGLSLTQKRKFLLADNQNAAMTGNDYDAVATLLAELDGGGVELADIGFSEKELDHFLNYTEEEDEGDTFAEAGEASLGAFELKDSLQLVAGDCTEKLGLPKLLEGKLAELGDVEFVVWMNRHRTAALEDGQMHYHLFGRESTKGLDPFNTLMSFYIDDVRFERVWSKLKENTQRMLNADVYAVTMPDFTCIEGWPLPKNLWNLYRSFYTALYWQAAGISVVPSLTCWDELSMLEACAAVPKHAPTVSVQMQTVGGRSLRSGDGAVGADPDVVRTEIGNMLDIIKPESLIVYAGGPGLTLGQEICKRHGVRFIGVQNRATAATEINSERGF